MITFQGGLGAEGPPAEQPAANATSAQTRDRVPGGILRSIARITGASVQDRAPCETVVAEGVETAEQERFLRVQGCDALQGFRLARPMPAADPARLSTKRPEADSDPAND